MAKNFHFHRPTPRALRIGGVVAAVALAAGGLTACSSGTGSGDRTTITFSYLWTGREGKALEKVIDDFNHSQTAITVKGVSSPDATKQLAAMSSSTGGFDVSDNFGTAVGAWAAKGIIAPLDDYGFDTTAFVPSAMEQMRYQGKLYALPLAVHNYKLLYNKKLFSEAGIAEPPQTMDEFASDIAKLTKIGSNGAITQLGFGTTNPAATMQTLGYVFGGDWNGGGKPTPTDTKAVQGVDWYAKNVLDKYGAQNVSKFAAGYGQYMSAQDPFYTGKVAMVIDGEWQSANIKAVAPSLDWGVAPIPAASPSLENATETSNSMVFIPANSQHKKQAATFLKYLTGPTAMRDFTLALGNSPARTSLLDSKAYGSLPGFQVWQDGLKSPHAKTFASKPYTSQYSSDLGDAFSAINQGTQTPQQALSAVVGKTSSYDQG